MPRPDPAADECALIAAAGDPVTTVALPHPVDPANAPNPSNESERLLFRQVYETLLRVDCKGRAAPGLAASWRLDADGRTWTVTLREDARFSDGTPLTAADVRASWSVGGAHGELRQPANRLVGSVVAVDDRTLAVTLRTHRSDVPVALAHTDLAVSKPVSDSPWPLGTRAGRISSDGESSRTSSLSVVTLTRDAAPAIRFLASAGDPRDLLDQGADLLLTRDPAALEYAATLPHFQSTPLPWQRIHVLLAPGRSPSNTLLSEDARQALASDAIRGEARGARGPFWWETLADCEVPSTTPRSRASPTSRIVYDASDSAARDLAERVVGLARTSGSAATAMLDVLIPDRPRRSFDRATGLTGEPLARARRQGNDAGYVISLDSRSVEPCRDMQALIDAAPWADAATMVPLVETRLQAIVRRGRAGLTTEWDGGLVLAGDPHRK